MLSGVSIKHCQNIAQRMDFGDMTDLYNENLSSETYDFLTEFNFDNFRDNYKPGIAEYHLKRVMEIAAFEIAKMAEMDFAKVLIMGESLGVVIARKIDLSKLELSNDKKLLKDWEILCRAKFVGRMVQTWTKQRSDMITMDRMLDKLEEEG